MLDIKYIKENPEDVIERLARKGKARARTSHASSSSTVSAAR